MLNDKISIKTEDGPQIIKFALNGIVATLVHFLVLKTCIEIIEIPSAGISSFFGSALGITSSFLGNRFFVFRNTYGSLHWQAIYFLILYFLIALLNGLILFVWTDIFGLAYEIGFLFATVIQFILSYTGNKLIVFKSEHV